jgi:hypothetical protein
MVNRATLRSPQNARFSIPAPRYPPSVVPVVALDGNTRVSPRQGSAPSFNGTGKIRAGTVLWHKEHARPKACIRHVITACVRHFEITFERARLKLRGSQMKKLVIALLATVVAFSVAGCVGLGKGKARPAVVTKG